MDADLAPGELESEDSEDSEEKAGNDKDEDENENKNEEDDEGMPDELKKIKKYLLTLKSPVGMSEKVYDSF